MARIEEQVDTVMRCKECFIPLGFKFARGINDLCWECGSSEEDAELRETIAQLYSHEMTAVMCDYCGDVFGQEEITSHVMPDRSRITSCWPCAAEIAHEIKSNISEEF